MTDRNERLTYYLCRLDPDAQELRLQTNYGEMHLDGELATRITRYIIMEIEKEVSELKT